MTLWCFSAGMSPPDSRKRRVGNAPAEELCPEQGYQQYADQKFRAIDRQDEQHETEGVHWDDQCIVPHDEGIQRAIMQAVDDEGVPAEVLKHAASFYPPAQLKERERARCRQEEE